MMDENTTKSGYDRWCPSCGVWVKPDDFRVREGEGLKRHAACETVTSPTKTTAGEHIKLTRGLGEKQQGARCTCDKGEDHFDVTPEMEELATRMAADEADEGNFAAAAELKAFADGGPVRVGKVLEDIPADGTGIVMLGGRLEALTTMDSWRAAFAADLRRLLPQVTGAKLHAEHVVALAGAFVDAGWVPGARRRAAELPKATATISGVPVPKIARHITVAAEQVPEPLRSRLTELADPDRYEEQPIEDADGAVIGHVWELQSRHCLEHEREWVAAVDGDQENRPRFGSRDGAEGWVHANAPRDGRPLTVPYDAEKVLGVKDEVFGWVWLDPEHASDDGRWLAVHGAAPEHQHPLWGSPAPGPDARNQAIDWVLEQNKGSDRD